MTIIVATSIASSIGLTSLRNKPVAYSEFYTSAHAPVTPIHFGLDRTTAFFHNEFAHSSKRSAASQPERRYPLFCRLIQISGAVDNGFRVSGFSNCWGTKASRIFDLSSPPLKPNRRCIAGWLELSSAQCKDNLSFLRSYFQALQLLPCNPFELGQNNTNRYFPR